MEKISIKVTVADRVYPLRVALNEEEIVRKAAKDINEHLKNLQKNYEVRDMQDLFVMSCLHYATKAFELGSKNQTDNLTIDEKLLNIDQYLNSFLVEK